jgi:hypothetical protein
MNMAKLTAHAGGLSDSFIYERPIWGAVLRAYNAEDSNDYQFLKKYFGDKYWENDKYNKIEPGAARISIALIKSNSGGMERKFNATENGIEVPGGINAVHDIGYDTGAPGDRRIVKIIGTAKELNTFLWKEAGWSDKEKKMDEKKAEAELTRPTSIAVVHKEIIKPTNIKQPRNGIYIIVGPKRNHATLWLGNNQNVICGTDYITTFPTKLQPSGDSDYTVYFWELKDIKAKIENIYWSRTKPDGRYEKIEKHDAFYVDLNLHVVTEDGGEIEDVVIKRDDKELLYESYEQFDPTTIDNKNIRRYGKEIVFENVLEELKLNLKSNGENAKEIKILAYNNIKKDQNVNMTYVTIDKPRPRWRDVFEGYPAIFYDNEHKWIDILPEDVFASVLGESGRFTYNNACATRVSIALLKAGIVIPKIPLDDLKDDEKKLIGASQIKVGEFAGKGYFIRGAQQLQRWLTEKLWGKPDERLYSIPSANLDTHVRVEKIGNRNGVYASIYVTKAGTGHTTLWGGTKLWGVDKDGNVFNERRAIRHSEGSEANFLVNATYGLPNGIFFWELKCVKKGCVGDCFECHKKRCGGCIKCQPQEE